MGGGVYVTLPEMAISFARGLILQMWVRPDGPQDAVLFALGAKKAQIRLLVRTDGSVELLFDRKYVRAEIGVRVGGWNHLTVVLGRSLTVFYLDGVRVSSSGGGVPREAARTGNTIGVAPDGKGGGFIGAIADVRLWNRSSGVEVILDRRLRDLRGDEPGLVGRWTLEGSGGACDTSSFGRDGTRIGLYQPGASSITITPPLARCLDFSGNGSVVIDAVPLSASRGFTWQAHVLIDDLSRPCDLIKLIGFAVSTSAGVTTVSVGASTFKFPVTLRAKSWVSLGVRVGTDGKVSLFFGGKLVLTGDVSGLAMLDMLGGYGGVAKLGEGLDGQMAEVRLWERALSDAEMADTSNRRIHGWAPGLLGCWHFDEEIELTSAPYATIYADGDFKGASQKLVVGRYDVAALKIGNDKLSSLRVPAGLRVTLYEHGGFTGQSWVFTSDTALVANNDLTSSIVVEEINPLRATIFTDPNFMGPSQSLQVGRYDVWMLAIGNDKLSSLRVPQGLAVTLFEHSGFTGRSWVYTADTPLVINNELTSSIVVERLDRGPVNAAPAGLVARAFGVRPISSVLVLENAPRVVPPRVAGLGGALALPTVEAIGSGGFTAQMWVNLDPLAVDEVPLFKLDGFATVYSEPNFAGTAQVLRRGGFDGAALKVGNDTISSIRVASGTRATLYEYGGFRGRTRVVDKDLAQMGDFNDLTSSIRVAGPPAVEVRARRDGDAIGLKLRITEAGNEQASSIRVEVCGPQVLIFTDKNYNGAFQSLGVGRYDVGALTIGNDTLSSLRVPRGLKVTLYEYAGFKGPSVAYTTDTALVSNNNRTSSIVVEELDPLQATIYADSGFLGTSQRLGVGRYDVAALAIGDNKLSSLRVPEGLKVTLYEDTGFSGRSWVFTTDMLVVPCSDVASSIVVEAVDPRQVTIYAGADFTGTSQRLSIGSHDLAALTIGDNTLSSLQVPEGLKVTVFDSAGFTGRSRVFTADTALIGTEEIVIERAFTARRWTHLTITQDADGVVCVYAGGRLIRREEMRRLPPQSLIPQIGPFSGSVTEVRLSPRALTPEEIAGSWQRRLADSSSARWALAGSLDGTAGAASGAVTWREAPSLALQDPSAPVLATVRSRASLQSDPSTNNGKPQLCVDLTACDASGYPLPFAALTVVIGEPIEAYNTRVQPERRINDTSRFTLQADARGKARLVLVPTGLRAPILKVRHPSMYQDAWALVTPDQVIFDALASLTASELKGGRRAGATTTAGTSGLIRSGEEVLVELLRGMFSVVKSKFSFEAESTAALAFGDLEGEAEAPALASVSVVGENLVRVDEHARLVRRLIPVGTAVAAGHEDELAENFFLDWVEDAWDYSVTYVTDATEPLVDAVTDVGSSVIEGTTSFVEAGLEYLGELPDSAQEALDLAYSAVGDLFDSALDLAQTAVETVENVAEIIAEPVVEAISAVAKVYVNGIAIAKTWVIETVEDVVDVAVEIFQAIGKTCEEVLDFIAVVFDWSDILATADMMLDEVKRALVTSRLGVGRVIARINASIQTAETSALELLGGGTLPAPTRPAEASVNVPLPDTPDLLELLLSKLPDDLTQTIADMDAAFAPMKDLLTNALAGLTTLGDGLSLTWNDADLKAALADPRRFLDDDPAEWRTLARLLVSVVAAGISKAVEFVGSLASTFLTCFEDLLDVRLNIPELTNYVETHVLGGASLTVGRLCCLVVAIPLTTTYKLYTGSKTGPAALAEGALNFADSPAEYGFSLTQRSMDIVGSLLGTYVDSTKSSAGSSTDKELRRAQFTLDSINWVLTAAGLIAEITESAEWENTDQAKFCFDLLSAGFGLAGLLSSLMYLHEPNAATDQISGLCGAFGDGSGVVSGIIDVCANATDDEKSKSEVAVASLDLAATVASLVASVGGLVPKEAANDPITKAIRTGAIVGGNVVGVACKVAALGVYAHENKVS